MATSAPTRTSSAIKAALKTEKEGVTGITLRVHSAEAVLPRGRVLVNWSVCHKPHTGGKGNGCRNGLSGFFIRTEDGDLKRVFWVGKKGVGGTGVCDWTEGEEDGEGGEVEGEDGGVEDDGEQEMTEE